MAPRRRSSPGPYVLYLEVVRERIEDATAFPFSLPVLAALDVLEFHPRVTFLIGENGAGKSTLLEAIAVASRLNPEGGSRHFNFATRASHSNLHDAIRLAKAPATMRDAYFLRAETFYNVASEVERLGVDEGYGGGLHEQSHGESFFALFRNRFRRHGFYLLDEPEAALSPARQLEFLAVLHAHVQAGCQFVIATHSPIIMAYPDALIYQLGAEGIHAVPYAETEHYNITRGFLANPARALKVILGEGEGEGEEDEGDA